MNLVLFKKNECKQTLRLIESINKYSTYTADLFIVGEYSSNKITFKFISIIIMLKSKRRQWEYDKQNIIVT